MWNRSATKTKTSPEFWINSEIYIYVQIVSGALWNDHFSNKMIHSALIMHRGSPQVLPQATYFQWPYLHVVLVHVCCRPTVTSWWMEAFGPATGTGGPPLTISLSPLTYTFLQLKHCHKAGTQHRQGLWTAARRWLRFPEKRREGQGPKLTPQVVFQEWWTEIQHTLAQFSSPW